MTFDLHTQLESSEALIKLVNVTKTYDKGKSNEFKALRDIDLEINKGDFVAIMGPSGSGKSTLMNILGALDVSTTGHYYIEGKDISKLTENQLATFRNRDVGFVFQQFNLLARTNVRDNVLLPTLYGELPNREARMLEVLEKVGLLDKIDSKPNQLSGGQVQRVAIARALIMKPAIIMADEPTGNLDTKTSQEIMEIFRKLNEEGNTIILITHEEDIANYAKRVLRIKDGIVVSETETHYDA